MVTRELLVFIQNEQARGLSHEEITLTLVKEGWELADVKDALSMATHFKPTLFKREPDVPVGPNADGDHPRPMHFSAAPFLVFAICVLVLTLGLGVYMVVPSVHTTIDLWIALVRRILLI